MTNPQAVLRKPASGFTLLELLVVLVVLGLIASVVTPQVMNMLSGAKASSAGLQIESLSTALNYYQIDVGEYPSEQQGLQALMAAPQGNTRWRGPYVRKRQHLLDPWGRPFQYRQPGQHGPFDLFTLGADGKAGGQGDNADLGSWDAK